MTTATRESPLEILLLLIARSAPQPWYPRVHAEQTGSDPGALAEVLEWLYLEGLVEKAGGSPQTGPGVQLTALGQEVVNDPEALTRLRAGEPVRPDDKGAVIRESLTRRDRGMVSKLVLLANFAVFGWCLWLAYPHKGLLQKYIGMASTEEVVTRILEPAGGVSAVSIIRGEWWRLLTACFVHGGALHVIMNMYAVWAIGRFVEQTWGWWRYLIVYLVAGWGGSCLALAWAPTQKIGDNHIIITGVGASGALCGLLGAAAVWAFLYGRYLPRTTAKRLRSNIFINSMLILFMSLLPGVSGLGHLGGAVLGAATALVLHFERFGPRVVRPAAWVALLALPALSYAHMQHERVKSEGWHWAERFEFRRDHLQPILQAMYDGINRYKKEVEPVYDKHPDRREEPEVKTALDVLDQLIGPLERLIARLARAGPYYNPPIKKAQELALDYARLRVEVFRETARCLQLGKEWKRSDQSAYEDLWDKLNEARTAWESQEKELLKQRNRP